MKNANRELRIIISRLAIALIAGLYCVVFIAGLGGTPAGSQTVNIPEFNPYAKVELKQADAAGIHKATLPVLPHELVTAPLPEKSGCFYLLDDSWQKVPCATEAEMKNIRRPVVANSIQSIPAESQKNATPLIWGAVATALQDPDLSEENDVLGKTKTPNTFSIQTNTNTFTCSSCKDGSPFAASKPGDTGWTQFVYQQSGSGKGVSSYLCVWDFDITAYFGSKEKDGCKSYCVIPSKKRTMLPLTGAGAPDEYAEVIGYIDCSHRSKASPDGCRLWAFAKLPWAKGGPSWWAVSGPDILTLADNWNNVNGDMYGEGNGSKAVFSNATLTTWIGAFSCDTGPQHGSSSGVFTPKPCKPSAKHPDLNATPAKYDSTAESNNLVSGDVNFECQHNYECLMGYTSTID